MPLFGVLAHTNKTRLFRVSARDTIMPTTNRLTDTALRAVRPDPSGKVRKLTDGDGLFLQVDPRGGKYWRFSYRWDGKQKTLAFGTYPDVPLALARSRRVEARQMVAAGTDPAAVAKAAKAPRQSHLFDVLCQGWLDTGRPDRTEQYQADIEARIARHIAPHTRGRAIESLSRADWQAIFDRVYDAGRRDMTWRLMGYITRIYRYANARGIHAPDPTVGMDAAYPRGAPAHHPSITDPMRLSVLLRDIEQMDDISHIAREALWLYSRLFVRPRELQVARWPEFDLDAGEWRIPAERMGKTGVPHIVPLAPQVVTRLRALHRFTGHAGWLLPSERGWGQPMSEGTANQALKRLGYKGIQVAHGFRSTASTIMHEAQWIHLAIERQLSHIELGRGKSAAAYNYAEYLDYRVRMMRTWANYLDALAAWKPDIAPLPRLPREPG